MVKIFHNPRCKKSREAKALLEEKGVDFEVIEYLKTPPTQAELTELINCLGIEPEALIRKQEVLYKENYKGKSYSNEEWITILSENPKLIERPIVIKGDKAVVARPAELAEGIL